MNEPCPACNQVIRYPLSHVCDARHVDASIINDVGDYIVQLGNEQHRFPRAVFISMIRAPQTPFKYRLVLKFDHGVERIVEGEYPGSASYVEPYREPLKFEERDVNHRECQRQDSMFAHQLANAGGLLNESLSILEKLTGDEGAKALCARIRYFREHGRPKS